MFRSIRSLVYFLSPSITSRSGQLVDLTSASKNFLDLVKPQVTDTSSTASDNARADALIQQLIGSSQDDHQALVDSILKRSAIDFAPARSGEINSGGYNSSVLTQLQNEARARATSEATGAVTQANTEAARTAAQLEAAKLNANRKTTVQPPTSIGALLKTVGISVAASKILGAGLNKLGVTEKAAKAIPGSSSTTYDELSTPSGAASYDTGTGPWSTAGGGGEVGGQVVAGTQFGQDAGLSSEEIAQILGTAGDTTLGNTASFAALTDSSLVGGPAATAPTIFGDFSTPLGVTTGAVPSSATALAGGSGPVGGGAGYGATGAPVPGAANDLATGTVAAESDVLSGASSQTAVSGSGAITGDAGAVGTAAPGFDAALLGSEAGVAYGTSDILAHPETNLGATVLGLPTGFGSFLDDIGASGPLHSVGDAISNVFSGW